jgi:hypothetical protein
MLSRHAKFHTELELIPIEMHDNLYIKQPLKLEQVRFLILPVCGACWIRSSVWLPCVLHFG